MVSEDRTSGSQSIMDSLQLLGRVLTFRFGANELLALNRRDLAVGLVITWLVGMGRFWDNPRVELLQKSGMGSVIYVFVLSGLLYFVIWPLRPRDWSWLRLLTFITFTSPPGFLYAIPVQMIFPEEGLRTANAINVGFLAVVSVWRVSLLIAYLRRAGHLASGPALAGTALPILALIVALTILNLDRVVFNVMGGIDESQISSNDSIYMILIVISLSAMWVFPIVLLVYGLFAFWALTADNAHRDKDPVSDRDCSGNDTISGPHEPEDGYPQNDNAETEK